MMKCLLKEDRAVHVTKTSPALSLDNTIKFPASRKVGVLIEQGFNDDEVLKVLNELKAKGEQYEVVSERHGMIVGSSSQEIEADHTFTTTDSVLYDAIYAVGGPDVSRKFAKEAARYIGEALDHYKLIGAAHDGQQWLQALRVPGVVLLGSGMDFTAPFLEAITAQRHWKRQVD